MSMLKADELTAAVRVLRATWQAPADIAEELAVLLEVLASRWIADDDLQHYPACQQVQEAALAIARAVNE